MKYRVINTDNHGSDYPDESFVCEPVTKEEAEAIAEKLNEGITDWCSRYHMVVPEGYKLQPGFEP